jgi:hypothetical protein
MLSNARHIHEAVARACCQCDLAGQPVCLCSSCSHHSQHNDLVDQASPITSTSSNTRSSINTFGAANAFGEGA